MGKFTGNECDECGKIEKSGGMADKLPEGWLTVSIEKTHDQVKRIFCTKKCGKKWISRREQVEKNLATMTEAEFCEAHCNMDENQEYPGHDPICIAGKF